MRSMKAEKYLPNLSVSSLGIGKLLAQCVHQRRLHLTFKVLSDLLARRAPPRPAAATAVDVEREKLWNDGVPQRGMKWVFQSGCDSY